MTRACFVKNESFSSFRFASPGFGCLLRSD